MLGEFVFDAADVVFGSASNMRIQIVSGGEGVLPDLFNLRVESLASLLLKGLEFGFSRPFVLEDDLSGDLDGISRLSDVRNFVLGAISDTRVGHRVSVIAIGAHFKEQRSVFDNISTGPFDSFSDHQHVLGLNFEARDEVTTRVELNVVGGSVLGCAHSVVVILAHVNDRQVPKTRHVGSLGKLALIRSSITIRSNRKVLLSLVLLSEGESSSDGHLCSHDSVTAIEMAL